MAEFLLEMADSLRADALTNNPDHDPLVQTDLANKLTRLHVERHGILFNRVRVDPRYIKPDLSAYEDFSKT